MTAEFRGDISIQPDIIGDSNGGSSDHDGTTNTVTSVTTRKVDFSPRIPTYTDGDGVIREVGKRVFIPY